MDILLLHKRGLSQRGISYIRFETEPGRQAQVDFGKFQVALPDVRIQQTYLFSMISEYSRTKFSIHYGFKSEVAPAYAPWVKGKGERPFSFIREAFGKAMASFPFNWKP